MKSFFRHRLPQLTTAAIFLLLFAAASVHYDNFGSTRNFASLFINNAALGVVAIGMTLVIFSGGIDLSVGAVAGFSNIFATTMVENHGWHPLLAMTVALLIGALYGTAMGTLVHVFKQPAFLITLAGMFFARSAAFWVSEASIEIKNLFYRSLTDISFRLPDHSSVHPLPAEIFIAVLVLGYLLGHHTRFGRNLLAIGGNEQSALLMGLPVGKSKIAVYALCSALAALAGLVTTCITGSGNSIYGIGLELDAIATVVIGGTLLTGGRGHIFGTLCGVLIVGTIQSAIAFDGSLSSWWTRIITGGLLLAFILLQRVLLRATQKRLA